MTSTNGDISARTLRQLDRLVSASSPSDALESIQILTSSLEEIFKTVDADKQDKIISFISTCYENVEFMTSLCSLLSDGTMRSASSSGATMIVDDGDSTACSFLSIVLESLDLKPKDQIKTKGGETIKSFNQERQKHLKKMLSCPNDGAIVHALVDLLSPGHHDSSIDPSESLSRRHNLYAQTQALKILSSLISTLPTLIHSQILSAPDGLNRILDLLHNGSTEESIRNEAILLCTSMAKTNSGCARLMIFGEAYEKVLQIAESEISHDNQSTGVSSASIQVIVDCFNLAIELTKQDEMGSEVFLGNKSLVKILVKFLDLRTGEKFLYPEIAGGASGSNEDDADDLDDILNNGKKAKTTDNIDQIPAKIPYLTDYESSAVLSALELLRVLIVGDDSILKGFSDDRDLKLPHEKKRSKQQTILSYDVLSRLVIDMALYTLPPPDSPASVYVSAVPLHKDQLKALDVFAALSLDCGEELQNTILNKQGIYLHAGVLDRLMYLVCTGDGANRPAKDADEISMYALGVLRCLLSAKEASIMVMHTIAPPMDDQGPEEPPVFQKLVNTLVENLYCLIDSSAVKLLNSDEIVRINRMVIGAAGALGIFLTNGAGDTTREMLLRVPVPPPKAEENSTIDSHRTPLIDCMLAYLEQSLDVSMSSQKSTDVVSALLRLLVEWIPSAPHVISAIFSASNSISLSVLLQKKAEKGKTPIIQSLSALFWGLCLEYMNPEEEIGGWNSASIVNMISNGMGIRKFTQILESLKTPLVSNDCAAVPPWTCSPAERTYLLNWYAENVSIVRKRTVQELTFVASTNDDSDGEDVDHCNKDISSKDQKTIYKLVSEQNLEIESLRKKLADSENNQLIQSAKIKMLQKRLEANPSQLDDMLNELMAKNLDLEAQNRNIENDAMNFKIQNEKEIKSKAEEIMAIQKNMMNLENEKKRILEEQSSIQKELEGLSSAYSSLEQEYNRISNNVSMQEEVVAVSSYRKVEEDNLKLKQDVHAANEWMRKAVQKMDDLKRRNQSLELELNKSKSADIVNPMGTKIESLTLQLTSQSAQIDLLSAERDRLNLQIEELTFQLSEAENKSVSLNSLSKDPNTFDDSIVSDLNDKIINLEHELEKRGVTSEDTIRKLRDSLISKDEKIVDLEQKLEDLQHLATSTEMDDRKLDEIQSLKDEMEKMTEANKAAQEWMSNAVQRYNSLKKQLEDAKVKISDLENDNHANSDVLALEEQLNLISLEKDRALEQMRELEPLKDEIEILRSDHSVKFRELKDEKERIIAEKSQLISDLETKLLQVTVNESECEDIQRLRDENETLIAERQEHLVAIEDMKVRLTEFQSWTETAQLRINDLEAEKESIEKELQGLKSGEASDNVQDYVLREDLVVPSDSIDIDKMVESSSDLPSVSSKDDEGINQKNDGPVASLQILAGEEESLKEHLKDKVFTLEAELSQLRICIEEKDVQIQMLSKEMESSQSTENDGPNTEIASLRVSICDLENKNQELSIENESLQKSCSDLRTQIHDIENMLAKKETEISDLIGKVEEAKVTASVLRNEYENAQKHTNDIIKELKSENAKLLATIHNQEHETETAISEWEQRCQDLEGEIEKLRSESNADQDALAAISQWESRCSELEEEINRLVSEQDLIGREELEHEIEELKSTITLLQDEANNAISQWEERSTEMEDEIQRLMAECSEMETLRQQLTTNDILIKELMANVDVERENVVIVQKEKDEAETIYRAHIEELEGAITSHEQENLFLQSQLDERDDLVEKTNQQNLALSKELDEIRTESENVVKEWQENSNQQEETISDLRRTIESQNEEAVMAIQQWESRCDILYKKIEELESELEDCKTSKTVIHLKDQLDIRTEELCKLQIAFDDKVKKEQNLIQDLQDSQQLCANLQNIRDERNNLLSGRRSMEDEIERLRSAVSELERTHQDQNDQIQVMKDAQVSDCSALKKEREDNALLKEELKQLGDDFALLLGANEQDPFGFNTEKITSKAAIDIMEKERKEINSLRSSLGDLQEELNDSRQREQDAHIKLSETLQLLESSEKQISSKKSEIEILQFTLESEKQNYLQQQSELEKRIRHLEKDFQDINASYTKNVEKLRNELTSTKSERDRLIYALEESERINSTFVHRTSLMSENSGTNNLETEVSKLQSEKAKLLMTVSMQSSSNEKRIRNALSGDISDTVSKSEFTSLQAQFENVSIEYDKAKIRNDELLSLVQDAKKLSYEKERLEHEVAALEQEKSLLESSFTQKFSSYQDSYAELEKRYIESETKLRELQQAQESGKVVNDNESNRPDSDSDYQGYIEELKGELKQSKSLYQDLWTEHEDLLALLAQQDCEKRCLEEALVSSEGHEALDRIMASVQEKLKNELGIMM